MTVFYIEILVIAVSLAFLIFLSTIEGAVTQSSTLTLRAMLEGNENGGKVPLLPLVLDDKMQVLVPLHLGTQATFITIAILTTHLSLNAWEVWGVSIAFFLVCFLSLFFRQLVPRLLTQNEPERKLVLLLVPFKPVYLFLHALALPLSGILGMFKRLHQNCEHDAEPSHSEATEEEIQAYLGIGEDEGILEEEDSKLIQSVVEFGDTLVKEVMTPRTKIVACEEGATIAALRDVMVNHKHSRIPIYRSDVDHIIGIAYIRQLLSLYSRGTESDSIEALIHPALFVPETKPVSSLLKELQDRGDHTAIVIDEFGGVAGLVTIEDLIEEIVGEIRDEDQAKASEVIEDGPHSYIFRGTTELHRLEEVAGKKFVEMGCSTVAGLVVGFLGRVPAPGEEFDMDGLRIQILDADRKRVHRLRIQYE